jgi:hypothetical protein
MSLSHRGVGNQYFDRTVREPREAIIRTTSGLTIRGTVYLIPSTRFTDLLERDTELFIAVTSATIETPEGRVDRAGFIAVNKQQLVTLEEVGAVYEPPPTTTTQTPEQSQPRAR